MSRSGLHVSLIYYIHPSGIGVQESATLTIPVFQYSWLHLSPDLYNHPFGIGWTPGPDMESNIKTPEWSEWRTLDLSVLNGWGSRSGWHDIQYWNTGNRRSDRLSTQYSLDECLDQAYMQSNMETLEQSEWTTLDPILNGWVRRSGWHAIQYWNSGTVGEARPLTRYSMDECISEAYMPSNIETLV